MTSAVVESSNVYYIAQTLRQIYWCDDIDRTQKDVQKICIFSSV